MRFSNSVWFNNLTLQIRKMSLLHCMDIAIRFGFIYFGLRGVGKNFMVETLPECFEHLIGMELINLVGLFLQTKSVHWLIHTVLNFGR